jgi:hypothetical protein
MSGLLKNGRTNNNENRRGGSILNLDVCLFTQASLFFSVQEFRFLEDKKLSVVPMSRMRMHL